MSFGRVSLGVVLLALTLGPIIAAAIATRDRFLAWTGARARLAEAVFVLGALTLIGELLGTVDSLRPAPLVIASGALSAIVIGCTRRLPRREVGTATPRPPTDRLNGIVAATALAIVVVQWLAASIDGLRNGMQTSIDTLWYHGPMAALFAHSGSITAVHYFDRDPTTAFYPGGSELLHAMGIVLFGNDLLSPLLNLVFLALATTAAWCIGTRFGSGAGGLLGVLVVLGTPTMVSTQPGGSYNDVVGVAFLLAAVALFLELDNSTFLLALTAVAAGMAAGIKLTLLPLAVALTVVAVMTARRGRRLWVAAEWVALLFAMAGVWFVRNLVATGNPLPNVGLHLGPLVWRAPPISSPTDTVAQHLTNAQMVRQVYIPGLNEAFGAAWPAILIAGLGGSLLIMVRGSSIRARLLGGTAVFGIVVFLFMPQYLVSFLFVYNLRYVIPALVVAIVLLPSVAMLRGPRNGRRLVMVLGAVFAVTELRVRSLWYMTPQALAAAVFVIAIIVVIATFIVPRVTTSDAWAPQLLIVAAAALSLVAVTSALWWAERDYPESRYANASVAGRPVVALFRHVRDTRIATSGLFLQYPLFGPDLSNYVQYLGVRGRHGAFSQFRTCAAFKRAVNAGRYRYLVVTLLSFPGPTPTGTRSPELVWARSDSHLREVAQDGSGAATYRVTGALDPTSCPAGVTGDSSPSPIPIPG